MLYEKTYKNKHHFSFGKNWWKFIKDIEPKQLEKAKISLTEFLPQKEIKNHTFIDIGCGSGIFSLASYKLKAKKIISVDIDDSSIKCVKKIQRDNGNPKNWTTKRGSILDNKFVDKLGKYDIVYSWGVLHHTGNMNKAFENITKLCNKNGYLYIAIYNKCQGLNTLLFGSSTLWVTIKKTYNNFGSMGKRLMEAIYLIRWFFGLIFTLRNPIRYIKTYSNTRGMSFFTDLQDWLGGYPYEFATIDELINYFGKKGFATIKSKSSSGLGCHEILFKKL